MTEQAALGIVILSGIGLFLYITYIAYVYFKAKDPLSGKQTDTKENLAYAEGYNDGVDKTLGDGCK